MAESLTLNAPIVPPAITTWRVGMLAMDWDAATIAIRLHGSSGEIKTASYNGPTATALMIALNKANLSTTSLQKRVLQQLVSTGELAGTVAGTPD